MKKNNNLSCKYLRKIFTYLFLFFMTTILSAQNVNINKRNVTLADVFEEVENQTKLSIAYSESTIDKNRLVSVNIAGKPVKEAMAEILEGTGAVFTIEGNQILIKPAPVKTQQDSRKTITGIVTDESGLPIIGANVVEKGTRNGIITDIDGKFSLTLVQSDAVEVSYIGYMTQNVSVKNKTNISVVLKEDTQTLDEVVVVGYGTQKKVNLTGAVSSVSAEVMESRPVTNIAQALQGVVPNLNVDISNGAPNTFASYNVRGATSMSKNSNGAWQVDNGSPLILVDGIEMENFNLSALNPNDMESISVIKDASASAIYGARAAYGVILVTTKQGKKGKGRVQYSYDVQWNHPSARPDFMNSYESEYARVMNRVYTGGTRTTDDDIRLEALQNYIDNPVPENAWMYAPGSNQQSIWWVGNFDPFELMVRDWSPTQKHNVSISGGTEALRYYASLGFQDQDGFYKLRNDNMRRYNGMVNLDAQINDKFKVNIKLSYNATRYDEPLPYSYKGNPWSVILYQGKWNQNMPLLTGPNDPVPNAPTNSIVSAYAYSNRNKKTDRTVGVFTASPEYQVLPQLKLKADFSYRPSSYDVKDVEPEFRYIQDSWESMDVAVNTETGRISKTKEDVQLFTTNVYADYNQTFGKHTLGGLVGFNQEVWKKEQLSAGNTGIMSIGAPTLGNTYGVNPSKGEVDEHWAVRGVFMRINYNYSDRYLFEMNGRYDGSSKFPHDSRFKFFPSFSAAWRLSEESFMADTRSWLDNLKVRASYGSIGNQNVANYGFYSRMGSSQSSAMINGQRPYQVNPPGLISPDFTWETATTINGGLDVSLLSNRLNYSFDIYRRETKDIIMDGSTYPSVLGTSAPMVNSGKLRTHGWEMSLGWKDRLSNGFFYDLNFVLSDYQTEVALFNGNDNCSLGSLYTGKKVGEIWGYVTDRILQEGDIANNLIIQYTDENGNNLHRPNESNSAYYPGDIMYKDINGDGKVDRGLNTLDDHGDLKVLGNNTPRLKFGLTANFAWKGFDLNLFFQGVGKRDVWISDKTYWGDEDGPGSKKVYENSWTPEQTDAKYPLYGARRSQNWYTQSAYMFNGAYLRLKQAILGYTVPAEITNKIKMSKLRVYVSGFNLFEITELPDVYDPDLLSTSYPQMRSIALGVQVGF